MFTKYNEQCRKILISSREEMKNLKQQYIGTEHFLLSVLKNNKLTITNKLNRYNVYYNNYRQTLIKLLGVGEKESEYYVYTPLLKHILEESELLAKNLNEEYVSLEHIISIIFNEGDGVAIRVLIEMGINIEKLSKEFSIKKIKKNTKKKFMVEDYGYNMNQKAKDNLIDPVIGRENELHRIIEILCRRRKNNPLLIGEAGVGKTAIVEELSKRIVEGLVPDQLKSKKIISVSMASIISGTKYRGEFEERITKMLNEVETSDDIILFIDEIHTLVGAGGAEGAIDAANILKPFLARGKLKLIGATTVYEYKKYLESEKALERRFQTVLINEPDNETVYKILTQTKNIYEKYHNVIVSNEVLKQIIYLSNKYIYNRKQPDKAIDILDEACAKTALKKNKKSVKLENLYKDLKNTITEKNESVIKHDFNKAFELKKIEMEINTKINSYIYTKPLKSKKIVSLKTVATIVKNKTNIPIYEFLKEDLNQLSHLEKILNTKVIGQENIIKEICKDIGKIKFGYKIGNKPKSFFFVGPTGVGKTLLAKELCNVISNKDNFIRLDMSEFKESHSVSKIIGSPPGYVGFSNKNTVLDEIKIKPNAIILLDEVEKASPTVLNLFLQILDEGFIKTSTNEIVRFDNNIIIMTSNIGCTKESIGFNNNNKNNIMLKIKDFLGVELLNRIDSVLIFNELEENSIKKIIKIQEKKIIKNLNTNKKYLNQKDINEIVKNSNYQLYGARKLEKLICNTVIDKVVKEKLNKSVKITIGAQ